MLEHDRLATIKRGKQIDSLQIIDSSASQIRDGPACKGSAGEEYLDGGDGRQFNWLRGQCRGGHPGVDWDVTFLKHPTQSPEAQILESNTVIPFAPYQEERTSKYRSSTMTTRARRDTIRLTDQGDHIAEFQVRGKT